MLSFIEQPLQSLVFLALLFTVEQLTAPLVRAWTVRGLDWLAARRARSRR